MPSKDRDIVAQVGKCGSRGLDLIFPVLIQLTFLLLYEQVRVRVVLFFFRVRAARYNHMVTYDMYRSFRRFLGYSTPTDCGSCSAVPKMHHPAKRSLPMREHTGRVLRAFVVVFHCDICGEHSLIGRRNCRVLWRPGASVGRTQAER